MRAVYFDLETGGLLEQHPIIQIAAVAIDESTWRELGAIEMKLQFDFAAADPEALKINHWDAAVWRAEAILPGAAVLRFARFLEPYKSIRLVSKRTGNPYSVAQLAGHNAAAFDFPRISRLFRDAGSFLAADYHVLDTMHGAMWMLRGRPNPPENYKLVTLARYFGVQFSDGKAHDALADVRLTIQLARALRETQAPNTPQQALEETSR